MDVLPGRRSSIQHGISRWPQVSLVRLGRWPGTATAARELWLEARQMLQTRGHRRRDVMAATIDVDCDF